MSRRKQAKPRALKRELVDSHDESTQDTLPLTENFCANYVRNDTGPFSDSEGDDTSSSELEDINKYRCGGCKCMFDDLNEFLEHHEDCITRNSNGGMGGTSTPPGSLRSMSCTPDDTMSDTPGSSSCCPTPSSSSGGGGGHSGAGDPDLELSYTLGVTENTPYGCQFCDKAFPRLSYLKRHEQVHSDQMPFRCDYCHRFFKHKRSRDRHVKLHTGDRKYRCTQCESAFSRGDHLKIHMKTHDNGKPYQCTVCNRGYNTAAALSSHMQNHKKVLSLELRSSSLPQGKTISDAQLGNRCSESPDLQKPIICSFCPQLCSSPGALRDHVYQKHRTTSPIPVSSNAGCLKCPEDRLSPGALCTHKTEPISPVDHESPQSLTSDKFSPGQQLTCGFCSRSDFPSLESLQLHVQVLHLPSYHNAMTTSSIRNLKPRHSKHQGSSSGCNSGLVCDLCGQSFTSLTSLQKHNFAVHSLGDIFSKNRPDDIFCSQCNICFSSATALLEHVHLLHESSSMNHLSQLTNSNNKRSLSSNRVRHNGAKQLKSSLGIRNSPVAIFNGTSSFYKRHQGVDGIDGFGRQTPTPPKSMSSTLLCNQCNAAFQDFESFRSHLKNHLDEAAGIGTTTNQRFSCPECDTEFDNERILDCHVIGHFLSSTTEYGCQSCLKLFQKPDDLQKHLLEIHSQHLYRCALCKQLFDSKVSIQVHFAVKHSNECRSFKCISCGAYFRTELEFQVHVKVSHLSTCQSDAKTNQPFRCLLCDQVCTGEAQLRFHVATHKKPFPCNLCSEAFHVEFLLDRHVQAVHQQSAPGRALPGSPPTHLPFHNPQMQRQQKNSHSPALENCIDASSSDVAQNLTMKRVNSSVTVKTEKCAAETLTTASETPTTTSVAAITATACSSDTTNHNSLNHCCELCDSTFASDSSLNVHRRQVHNLKMHQKTSGAGSQTPALSLFCAYCNESCKSRHDLESHMKSHTGTPTRHKCNICDEVCPSAATLAEHKLTHCKVLSSSTCIVCRVQLATEEDFINHMHQHNGPNGSSGLPGPCVVCRQTLVAEVEVKMHAKFHTKLSSTNPQDATLMTHGICCVCSRQFDIGNLIIRAVTKTSNSATDILPHTYMCKECFHSKAEDSSCSGGGITRCYECGVKFETDNDLDIHRRCVHNGRTTANGNTYQCIKCQKTFDSEAEIQAHVTCHVIQEGTDHECKLCRKVLDSPSKLQCHLIEHTFEGCPSFTCYLCSSVFTGAHLLQQHMLEHGLDARPYDCTRCHHKFYFRAELENHTFVHHLEYHTFQANTEGGSPHLSVPIDNKAEYSPTTYSPYGRLGHCAAKSQLEGCYFCKDCKKDFPTFHDYQTHPCYLQEKNDSPPSVRGHEITEDRRYCSSKSEKFGNTTREKKHECPCCPKKFTRRENMRIHMKAHHNTSGDSEKPCPHCDKTFTRKSALKEHIQTHIIISLHTCEMCQETFSSKDLLLQHQSSSHGRVYEPKCPICGDVLADSETLKIHISQVHPQLKTERLECDETVSLSENTVKSEDRLEQSNPNEEIEKNNDADDGAKLLVDEDMQDNMDEDTMDDTEEKKSESLVPTEDTR